MHFDLNQQRWFQTLQGLPRPLLTAALCTAFAFYAWRAALGWNVDLAVFAALGTAAGVDVIRRGVEKATQKATEAKAAVEAVRAAPNGRPDSAAKPDIPKGELS